MIERDKSLERSAILFSKTPVYTADKFSAAEVDLESTRVYTDTSPKLTPALAAIIGLICGSILVVIRHLMKIYKRRSTA